MKRINNDSEPLYAESSTVRIGLLHSLSGTMAISEASLKDAELMAIAEINSGGGVLGKSIEPVIADGASNPATFALKVKTLIQQDKVATVFGGWTSASRKAMLPMLEELNGLLWYPLQYEGLECSPNIFYTGICPNQQVEPAVSWLLQNKGRKFYLVGSDYVFPRTINKLIKSQLRQQGGTLVGEESVCLGATKFDSIIKRIKQARPDVVFNTLNGDSNLAFYQQYKDAGLTAEEMPIMAVSIAEDELRRLSNQAAAGHYATWSYFQSLDTPRNQAFVQNFQAMYGAERVTSDPIETAYIQVYLWKQAVEKAGSFDVAQVRQAAYGQTFAAPGGLVRIEENNHLCKTSRIGKILPTGQFQVVHTSDTPIQPLPWLGMEEFQGAVPQIVIDMLAEVTQAIQCSCQLEEKSRDLQAAMAELAAANARLQLTQNHLIKQSQREELVKRRLSNQIRTSLEFGKIVTTAVTEIRNVLQIDRCKFFWYRTDIEPHSFELIQEASAPTQSTLLSPNSIQPTSPLGQVLLRQNLLRLDDIATAHNLDAKSRDYLTSLGLTSLLAVSINPRSGPRGLLVCEHGSGYRPWTYNEVEILQDLGDQLASAIDQAKLYEQSRFAAVVANAQAEQIKRTLHELQQTQAQLIQTEKLSSLGQMVAGIAHEINNPVNFIYGNLEYADEYVQKLLELVHLYQQNFPKSTPDIQKYIEAIELDFLGEDLPKILSSMKMGAERIRQIVLSLRNFSRIDEANVKPVNLHEGLDSTLLLLQHRLKAKAERPAIKVIREYGDLPLVECYPGQLNQVFMNILINAIDALEELNSEGFTQTNLQLATPCLWIRTAVVDTNLVVIRITDNGCGMTEEVQSRLFDPFFTTKPVGTGTGLGLSISYQIVVQKHKGNLKCVSEPGEGTEFWIEIPVRQEDKPSGKLSGEGPQVSPQTQTSSCLS